MTALSAPQRSITSLEIRDLPGLLWPSGLLQRRCPVCRATAPKFPAARACFMASWSGRRPSFSTRTRPKSAGVDKPNSGLHTTIVTCRQRRQVCQHLAPALCQCCAAPNTEGHVAAHLKADPLQLLPGHLRRIQRPQAPGAPQRTSALPPAIPACMRDTLFQQDLRTAVLGHAHSVIKGSAACFSRRCFPARRGDPSHPFGR